MSLYLLIVKKVLEEYSLLDCNGMQFRKKAQCFGRSLSLPSGFMSKPSKKPAKCRQQAGLMDQWVLPP
jgi:hypothetical protein